MGEECVYWVWVMANVIMGGLLCIPSHYGAVRMVQTHSWITAVLVL